MATYIRDAFIVEAEQFTPPDVVPAGVVVIFVNDHYDVFGPRSIAAEEPPPGFHLRHGVWQKGGWRVCEPGSWVTTDANGDREVWPPERFARRFTVIDRADRVPLERWLRVVRSVVDGFSLRDGEHNQ